MGPTDRVPRRRQKSVLDTRREHGNGRAHHGEEEFLGPSQQEPVSSRFESIRKRLFRLRVSFYWLEMKREGGCPAWEQDIFWG